MHKNVGKQTRDGSENGRGVVLIATIEGCQNGGESDTAGEPPLPHDSSALHFLKHNYGKERGVCEPGLQ